MADGFIQLFKQSRLCPLFCLTSVGSRAIAQPHTISGVGDNLESGQASSGDAPPNDPVRNKINRSSQRTDWQNEIFHTAHIQNYNIGSTRNMYLVDLGYQIPRFSIKRSFIVKFLDLKSKISL